MKSLTYLYVFIFVGVILLGTTVMAGESASKSTAYPRRIAPTQPKQTVAPDLSTPLVPQVVTPESVADTAARKATLCEGVTCSNHGRCVVKGGAPVCSCDVGLLPDAETGLHCIPAQLRITPQPVQIIVQPAVQQPMPDLMTPQRLQYERDQEMRAAAKRAMIARPEYSPLVTKRNIGLAGTIIGAVGMGLGVLSGGLLFEDDMNTTGWVIFGSGALVFLPSVIVHKSAKNQLRNLYQEEVEKQKRASRLRLSGVGPTMAEDGKGAGVSATFQF
ncbi:MAG: hypothetical protein JXX29_19680 [Deltaproteobacteria bacterium]|nr:hypothetical protein [Deltaproteobacteria bacterium]MBN2673911.1 hypothetical protein [Deltaproteobacteria bacterium]